MIYSMPCLIARKAGSVVEYFLAIAMHGKVLKIIASFNIDVHESTNTVIEVSSV